MRFSRWLSHSAEEWKKKRFRNISICRWSRYFKELAQNLLCSSSSLSRFIKNNECILSISRSQSIATFTHLGWGTLNATKEHVCEEGTISTKSWRLNNRPFTSTKHVTRCTRVMRYAKHMHDARFERFFRDFSHSVLVCFLTAWAGLLKAWLS